MKYELWISLQDKEFCIPLNAPEDADVLLDMLRHVRECPNGHMEWAINDLEEGCTLQVG